ncbi:ankyrin repeat-containing protein [Gossypium australe]|uniref:Ankyrin repeat-containing protein n=1 Tax=Gossypium australe TaxID=47621 RepID=A0A5B6UUB2_9ROSI|nr:ankyrin repeat-containing protein [Gossypium australe]
MSVEDLIVKLQIQEDNRGTRKNLNKVENVDSAKANVVEEISKEVSDMDLYAMISEVNMINSHPREWWLDTCATHHIYWDKDSFSKLVPCEKGEKLYMGNVATSKIKVKGTVVLKMTSGKELKL